MVITCAPSPVVSGLPNGASSHLAGERRAGRMEEPKEAIEAIYDKRCFQISRASFIGPPRTTTVTYASVEEYEASEKDEQAEEARLREAIEAEANVKAMKNPLVSLIDLKGKVDVRLSEIRKTLANHPISTAMLTTRIDDLDWAWIEFNDQHNRVSVVSGRGCLQGLQAYHAALKSRYVADVDIAYATLREEQAKRKPALEEELEIEAALKEDQEMKAARTIQLAWRRCSALKEEHVQKAVLEKVVMVGQRILACERAILAKTGAKAAEKAKLSNSSNEPSAGEVQAKETVMENVVFHG